MNCLIRGELTSDEGRVNIKLSYLRIYIKLYNYMTTGVWKGFQEHVQRALAQNQRGEGSRVGSGAGGQCWG